MHRLGLSRSGEDAVSCQWADRSNPRPHICHTSVLQLQGSPWFNVVLSHNLPAGSTADWVNQEFAVRREQQIAEKRAQRRQEAGERRQRNRFWHLQAAIGAEAGLRAESQAQAYSARVAHAKGSGR
jgi:hypothetical protein